MDRTSVVLVTKTLRVRCDSLASASSDWLSAQSPLAAAGCQLSVSTTAAAATPCSTLRVGALFATAEEQGQAADEGLQGGTPRSSIGAAALSFADWNAALQRANGISNPLARPPLPLALPGECRCTSYPCQSLASVER